MKKIALLGAGWLGQPLALHWLQKGHQVHVTTTREEKRKELETQGLLAQNWSLQDPIPSWVQTSDVVVFTIPPRPDPKAFSKQTMDFFQQLKERDYQGRVFFCSSISVLGDKTGVQSENDECSPQTSSALNLQELEKGLKELAFSSTTICRLGGLYGNERHPSRNLAKKSEVMSGGQKPVNLLHQTEAIEFFDRLLKTNLSGYEIFHVVNDVEASKSQFYPLCAQILSLSPIEYKERGRAQLNQGKRVSNAKIKNKIGVSFRSCPLA